jgi:hypothetical protein
MLVSRGQNADQNRDIKIAFRSFENVLQLQVFANDSNKSKFNLGGDKEETVIW